uniref:Uncharacterized protein n=1 Tax=Physcomitrium patens TaxID=3218 RepID=A0A7I3Z1Z6_PHYPA
MKYVGDCSLVGIEMGLGISKAFPESSPRHAGLVGELVVFSLSLLRFCGRCFVVAVCVEYCSSFRRQVSFRVRGRGESEASTFLK